MMENLINFESQSRNDSLLKVGAVGSNVYFLVNEVYLKRLDFHEVEKLHEWLEDWMYEQRDDCLNCGHERAGCQYHDG